MRRIFALLLLAACSSEASTPATSMQSAPILGGAAEDAYPGVGLLEFASGNFGTGTLISPRVVITAGHVAGGNIQGFWLGKGIPVPRGVNTTSSDSMRKIAIASKVIHPSYQCTTNCDQWKGWDLDVSLIILATPITDVAPARFGTMIPAKGATCRAVGFGDYIPDFDAADASPVVKQKRSGISVVSTLRPYTVETTWNPLTANGGIPDHGDSGGPLYCDEAGHETLVATVAFHTDGEGALHSKEWFMRTDVAMPWIEEQVRAAGDAWPPPQNAAIAVSVDAGTDASSSGIDASGSEDSGPNPAQPGASSGCSVMPHSSHEKTSSSPLSALFGLAAAAIVTLRRRR